MTRARTVGCFSPVHVFTACQGWRGNCVPLSPFRERSRYVLHFFRVISSDVRRRAPETVTPTRSTGPTDTNAGKRGECLIQRQVTSINCFSSVTPRANGFFLSFVCLARCEWRPPGARREKQVKHVFCREKGFISRGSFNEEPATGRSIDCPYRKSRLLFKNASCDARVSGKVCLPD